MKETFLKTPSGVYINSQTKEPILMDRRSEDPDFYRQRDEILIRTFSKILSPIMEYRTRENRSNKIRVLDLGCGTGIILAALSNLAVKRGMQLNLHGLDLDRRIMKKINNDTIQLTQATTDIMPYSDAVFDTVFSAQVIEHMPQDRIIKTLLEIRRVLKPGGLFYLETPNPESLEALAMGVEWPMYLPEHLTLIPPRPLVNMLKGSRFINVVTKTRMEVDRQVNELWEIARRLKIPGFNLLPWRFRFGLVGIVIRMADKGSITVGVAKKPS